MRSEEGRSVREIAALLGVSVASASRWTADITLSPGFIEALRQRNPAVNGCLEGTRAQSAAKRAVRLEAQASGRDLAGGRLDCTWPGACSIGPKARRTGTRSG
jgi:hypothetical protein